MVGRPSFPFGARLPFRGELLGSGTVTLLRKNYGLCVSTKKKRGMQKGENTKRTDMVEHYEHWYSISTVSIARQLRKQKLVLWCEDWSCFALDKKGRWSQGRCDSVEVSCAKDSKEPGKRPTATANGIVECHGYIMQRIKHHNACYTMCHSSSLNICT